MAFFDILRPNIEKLHDKKDIRGLVRAVEHSDEEIRSGARSALLDLMPGSCEGIVALAVDPDALVRSGAVRILETTGEIAVSPLLEFFARGTEEQSGYAALALVSIGEAAAMPLLERFPLLQGEQIESGITILAGIGTPALPHLREGLLMPSHIQRRGAALALQHLDAEPADDRERAARLAATGEWKGVAACGKEAVPVLAHLLGDDYHVQRVNAARTLGQIGDPATLMDLVGALSDPDARVRGAAVHALGGIGDTGAVPHLVSALRDTDHYVRMEAASALDRLEWYPENDACRVRYFIASRQWEKAAAIGEPAVGPLIEMLKDEDHMVRKELSGAIRSLGELSVRPLEEALNHPDLSIRNVAGEILVSLGQTDLVYRSLLPKQDESSRREEE